MERQTSQVGRGESQPPQQGGQVQTQAQGLGQTSMPAGYGSSNSGAEVIGRLGDQPGAAPSSSLMHQQQAPFAGAQPMASPQPLELRDRLMQTAVQEPTTPLIGSIPPSSTPQLRIDPTKSGSQPPIPFSEAPQVGISSRNAVMSDPRANSTGFSSGGVATVKEIVDETQVRVTFVKPEWVPDNTRTNCHNPNCTLEFTITRRRHHCRGCGQIFCSDCCENKTLLPPEFGYSEPQKVCFSCFNIFTPIDPATLKSVDEVLFNEEGHREQPIYLGWANSRSPKSVSGKRTKRVIIVGRYRLMVWKPSANQVTVNHHLYDVFDVVVYKARVVVRITKNQNKDIPLNELVTLDWEMSRPLDFVQGLVHAHRLITLGFPPDSHFGVKGGDPELEKQVQALPDRAAATDPGVAFISTYKAQCNYYRANVNQEVFLYITDCVKACATDFNLLECPGFDPQSKLNYDAQPLIATLYFNNYFRTLNFDQVVDRRAISLLCNVVRNNRALTRLSVANIDSGLVAQLSGLGDALRANAYHNIRHINLSGNDLGARCFGSICLALESMSHELISLNIARCGLSTPSIVQLFDVFSKNTTMSLGIEHLDVSSCRFDVDGSVAFQNWLMGPSNKERSNLRYLNLAGCNVSVPYITRGLNGLPFLSDIDLSNNKVEDAASGQVLASVLDFASSVRSLRLANCNLPADMSQHIVRAFGANNRLLERHLDISNNPLGDRGEVLLTPLQTSMGFHTLNFSGLKFREVVLMDLLTALQHMSTLSTLVLDNALRAVSSNDKAEEIARLLVDVLNVNPNIKALSLSGGFTRVLPSFITGLTSNASLLELDISNNSIEDVGALSIAVMLRDNSSLLSLNCDQNKITVAGWRMILKALANYNRTLQLLEFPWSDCELNKKSPLIRPVLLEIQQLVTANKVRSRGIYDPMLPRLPR